jgi:hypothetical protein
VEIGWVVRDGRVLHRGTQPGLCVVLVSRCMRKEGAASSSVLGSIPTTGRRRARATMVLDIIATSRLLPKISAPSHQAQGESTYHVVDDRISIYADTVSAACRDHASELSECTVTADQTVGNRLVDEPPRAKKGLNIRLRLQKDNSHLSSFDWGHQSEVTASSKRMSPCNSSGKDLLTRRGPDSHTTIASLTNKDAFFLNIGVWPSKKFDNRNLLSTVRLGTVNSRSIPNKICG